jgi:hypothetical protein
VDGRRRSKKGPVHVQTPVLSLCHPKTHFGSCGTSGCDDQLSLRWTMFRGKNDMLPTTGERSRAPHISTVQIPKVSTPTILTYVWLGVSLLVLVLGIIFCSHSPDRRWAGCLTCAEDNAPDEKTHWGRGGGGALCLRVRMRARGWRAIPRAGDTAGGRPVGCASPTRAVSRDARTRCRTCEVTETRARAPPPANVTRGRNETKTKPRRQHLGADVQDDHL